MALDEEEEGKLEEKGWDRRRRRRGRRKKGIRTKILGREVR